MGEYADMEVDNAMMQEMDKVGCRQCGKLYYQDEDDVQGYCPRCVDGMRGLLDD